MNFIERMQMRAEKFAERFLDSKKIRKDIDERLEQTAREITMRQTRGNVLIQWGFYDNIPYKEDDSPGS